MNKPTDYRELLSLQELVASVTGAGAGIGKAIAETFAAAGAAPAGGVCAYISEAATTAIIRAARIARPERALARIDRFSLSSIPEALTRTGRDATSRNRFRAIIRIVRDRRRANPSRNARWSTAKAGSGPEA